MWNLPSTPGTLECGVTAILNEANERGVEPEAMVRATARVLCLLALASRPGDVSFEAARAGLMQTVWETTAALGSHPFVVMDRAH